MVSRNNILADENDRKVKVSEVEGRGRCAHISQTPTPDSTGRRRLHDEKDTFQTCRVSQLDPGQALGCWYDIRRGKIKIIVWSTHSSLALSCSLGGRNA